jgi:cytochrome b561
MQVPQGQSAENRSDIELLYDNHYWLGYLAFFVSFAHAWLAMRGGNMRGINSAGVWFATVALLVILWQIVVGLMLNNPTQSSRRALRRLHFWTMALVAGLIVVHVALNRP